MSYPEKFKPYFVKNPFLFLYLKILDFLFFSTKKKEHKKIKKILIVNLAHLGDVILTTSLIPIIKKKYKNVRVGFLTASTNKELLKDHIFLDYLHYFDHLKNNRSDNHFVRKIYLHLLSLTKVFFEIKKIGYDVSIDVSCFYPNTHLLTSAALIPKRIGFINGGGGRLISNPFCADLSLYFTQDLLKLLAPLNIIHKDYHNTIPSLYFSKSNQSLPKGKFWIFHPFSIEKKKNLPNSFWRTLYLFFLSHGAEVVFTGSGEYEKNQIDLILSGDYTRNYADTLSIADVCELVKASQGVVCVDTMIAHLAKTYRKKNFTLFTIQTFINRWHDVLSENFSYFSY